MINKARKILKEVFGYDEFRSYQEQIISSVLDKKDTIAIMHTGSGKSLCYQIPALIFEGLTIVISPLISLMQDQINQLRELGVNAVVLNSSILADEYFENIQEIRSGAAKILYVAPETLVKENIINLLNEVKVSLFTIDEAHCISDWGHDFRPEYRLIASIRNNFSNVPCLALTATATERVQADIRENLAFDEKNSNTFVSTFDRDNLFLQVIEKQSAFAQTVDFLNKFKDKSGIIYCFSRRQVDILSEELSAYGFSVRPYHAGLSETERYENQDLFIKDKVQIIVATVAFGMGINKPNVRFVIHYDLPSSIERYYQEIGRAGRDGLRADCILLLSYGDISKIRFFIDQKSDHEKLVAITQLDSLISFLSSFECRRKPLLAYFSEEYGKENCGMCDNCKKKVTKEDLTILAQKLLSCIKRTDEIYGFAHIVDILRGSKAQKIIMAGHHKLSTYGIGKDLNKKEWSSIVQQLINEKILVKENKYGSLQCLPKVKQILSGQEKFFGVKPKISEVVLEEKISSDYNSELFEILRIKRREIADAANVPPYVIFPDKTLIELSTYFPKSVESLANMHGIGQVKLNAYGEQFLKIVIGFAEKNGFEEIFTKPTKSVTQRTLRLRSGTVG